MKKLKLEVKITSNNEIDNYKVIGNFDEKLNKIEYIENKVLSTKTIIDLNNNKLTRDNKDYYIESNFIKNKESIITILVRSINKSMELNIKTNELINDNNIFRVKYEILETKELVEYEIKY